MTERDFDAWNAERRGGADPKPLHTFTVGGSTFHVINPLPVVAVMHKARRDDSMISWLVFIEGVIEEPGMAFEAALASAKADDDLIVEIGRHVLEVGTNRPTKPRSGSRSSRTSTGTRSKPASRGTAPTRRTSRRAAS